MTAGGSRLLLLLLLLPVVHAGVSTRSLAEETSLDVDAKVMAINFFGPVGLTKAVLPYLRRKVRGRKDRHSPRLALGSSRRLVVVLIAWISASRFGPSCAGRAMGRTWW